jgi:hypothetical protein
MYTYVHNMKPLQMTVHEFRKDIKAALDFCVEGGHVEINRMGQRFILMHEPRGTTVLRGNILPTAMPTTLAEGNDPKSPGYSAPIRPDIQSKPIKTKADAVEVVAGKKACTHGAAPGFCRFVKCKNA